MPSSLKPSEALAKAALGPRSALCSLVFKICCLGALAFAFAATLSAQVLNVTDTTSTPAPGVGHDYIHMLTETVNPANGSVSIRIQTPVPPGRKLTLPFSFAYL